MEKKITKIINSIRTRKTISIDRRDKTIPTSKIVGCCLLNNYNIGLLLNDDNYDINQVYVGSDLRLHISPLSLGNVNKQDMSTLEGIEAYNKNISLRDRDTAIRKVILLNGTVISA